MDHLKMYSLLKMGISHCHVSLPECTSSSQILPQESSRLKALQPLVFHVEGSYRARHFFKAHVSGARPQNLATFCFCEPTSICTCSYAYFSIKMGHVRDILRHLDAMSVESVKIIMLWDSNSSPLVIGSINEYRIKMYKIPWLHMCGKDRNPQMIYFGIPPSRLLGSIGHLAKLDTSKVGLQHVLRIKHPRVSPEKGWILRSPTQIYHSEGDSNIQWTWNIWNPLHRKHEKKIRTSNEHKMKHHRRHVDRQLPEGKRTRLLLYL